MKVVRSATNSILHDNFVGDLPNLTGQGLLVNYLKMSAKIELPVTKCNLQSWKDPSGHLWDALNWTILVNDFIHDFIIQALWGLLTSEDWYPMVRNTIS